MFTTSHYLHPVIQHLTTLQYRWSEIPIQFSVNDYDTPKKINITCKQALQLNKKALLINSDYLHLLHLCTFILTYLACIIQQLLLQLQQFYGPLTRTTWVGCYQKKHTPTHTYPDHQSSFISFLHLLLSIASSLFNLRA